MSPPVGSSSPLEDETPSVTVPIRVLMNAIRLSRGDSVAAAGFFLAQRHRQNAPSTATPAPTAGSIHNSASDPTPTSTPKSRALTRSPDFSSGSVSADTDMDTSSRPQNPST